MKYILFILMPTLIFAEIDVREFCELKKIQSSDAMIKAQSCGFEDHYYYFMGKHEAYQDIINLIDKDNLTN